MVIRKGYGMVFGKWGQFGERVFEVAVGLRLRRPVERLRRPLVVCPLPRRTRSQAGNLYLGSWLVGLWLLVDRDQLVAW